MFTEIAGNGLNWKLVGAWEEMKLETEPETEVKINLNAKIKIKAYTKI
jgi:hypothetical protein